MLFIDASSMFRKRGRNQNTLEPEHAEQHPRQLTRGSRDVDGLARVVDLDEIAGNDYNLNISLYVAPADTARQVRRWLRHSRTWRLL